MITPEEMKARLLACQEDLIRTRARDMLVVGLDLIALVKIRVINKGEDADGQSFGPYSAAYARLRERKNLTDKPFPAKNFKFKTRMWNNTTAAVIKESRDAVTVRLAPTTQHEINKLTWNETREKKEIIALNERERAMLDRSIQNRYKRILNQNNII